MNEQAQFNLARGVVKNFKRKLDDADNLVKKARLVTERATSQQLKLNRELCATSMNDILETYSCTSLLDDPEFRFKLLQISAKLNFAEAGFSSMKGTI